MRSIRFDQLHTGTHATRRPISRELRAVTPPDTLPEASSTSLPAAKDEHAPAPRPASIPPRS
jgi:hypothetical protein